MVMKLYNGLKRFLQPVEVSKVEINDSAIRPTKTESVYVIQGSIALQDGLIEGYRPGGKVSIGDLYLQAEAGGLKAVLKSTPNRQTTIELREGDVIHYLGHKYEIKFVRDEPSICDIADFYASKMEVQK